MEGSYYDSGDYANAKADKAIKRLERIEAALMAAGIMQPPPVPPPAPTMAEVLKSAVESRLDAIFAEEEANGASERLWTRHLGMDNR